MQVRIFLKLEEGLRIIRAERSDNTGKALTRR